MKIIKWIVKTNLSIDLFYSIFRSRFVLDLKNYKMITLIFDYSNGSLKIINHDENQDVEDLLFKKMLFKHSSIEWMTVKELKIETMN